MKLRTQKMTGYLGVALALVVLAHSAPGYAESSDQTALTRTFKAHGGLEQWRRQRTFRYTLKGFPLSPQVALPSTSTVDLHTRNNRIESAGYTVGFDGTQGWSAPGPDAVGLPSRFYSLGSFYFIGMPFVFGDPGLTIEDKGTGQFLGKTYRVASVRFNREVGYTADDSYEVFVDPETDRLALINHSVTEIGVDRVTWVFNEWQQVNGLSIPARMTYYGGWNPQDPGEGTTFTIENVSFSTQAPDPAIYNPIEGAVIDQPATDG